jgi:hypothetical protein
VLWIMDNALHPRKDIRKRRQAGGEDNGNSK